jgi:hypothetical protein
MPTCLRSSSLDHKDLGGSQSLRELPPSIHPSLFKPALASPSAFVISLRTF